MRWIKEKSHLSSTLSATFKSAVIQLSFGGSNSIFASKTRPSFLYKYGHQPFQDCCNSCWNRKPSQYSKNKRRITCDSIIPIAAVSCIDGELELRYRTRNTYSITQDQDRFRIRLAMQKSMQTLAKSPGKPKTGTLFTKSSKYIRGPVKLYYREQSCEMVNSNITEEEKLNFDKVTTEIGGIGDMCSFSLVGSLNGLVCYVTLGVIYILNPITGERICLSSVKTRNKRKRICLPKMDGYFDCAGFGYCHRAEAYKVVKIRYRVNRMRSVQVYTLGDTSGWRDKPDTTYEFGEPGVFPNGALYWFSKKSDCHTILAFDLADETFQCLPSPLPGHIHSYFYMDVNLGSLEGNLYLCHPYKKEGERMMDIWMFEKGNMKNCQGSTHLKEQTGFTWSLLFSRKWDSGSQCQLLSLTKSEILLWQNNVLSYYDPTNFKKIWYAERKRFEVYQAIPHMHSLVSLKDLGEKLVRQEEGHPKNVATR